MPQSNTRSDITRPPDLSRKSGTGPVRLQSRAVRGQNTVISGIFIDPE